MIQFQCQRSMYEKWQKKCNYLKYIYNQITISSNSTILLGGVDKEKPYQQKNVAFT